MRVRCQKCERVVSDNVAQPAAAASVRTGSLFIFKSEPLMLEHVWGISIIGYIKGPGKYKLPN